MVVVWDRPIGAPADVAELGYVAALHQTTTTTTTSPADEEGREEGRSLVIQTEDIRLFLKSRYGIQVDEKTIQENILSDSSMATTAATEDDEENVKEKDAEEEEVEEDDKDDNRKDTLDLVELTAILLIPWFCKASKIQKGEELPENVQPIGNHKVFSHVCRMICHDVGFRSASRRNDTDRVAIAGDNENCKHIVTPRVSKEVIRSILTAYGEMESAQNDSLISSMVEALKGHEYLDADALATAVTSDLNLYNLNCETRYTNAYQDIMEDHSPNHVSNNPPDDAADNDAINERDDLEEERRATQSPVTTSSDCVEEEQRPKWTKGYTAPAIDSTAGTYRSKGAFLFLCYKTIQFWKQFSYLYAIVWHLVRSSAFGIALGQLPVCVRWYSDYDGMDIA